MFKIYKQNFRMQWLKHPKLKNWIRKDETNKSRAYCCICKKSIQAKLSDLVAHGERAKHKKRSAALAKVNSLEAENSHSEDVDDLRCCRLCARLAAEESDMLFVPRNKTKLKQIQDITGLKLRHVKNMPDHICTKCSMELEQAHQFRERCLQSHECFVNAKYKKRNINFSIEMDEAGFLKHQGPVEHESIEQLWLMETGESTQHLPEEKIGDENLMSDTITIETLLKQERLDGAENTIKGEKQAKSHKIESKEIIKKNPPRQDYLHATLDPTNMNVVHYDGKYQKFIAEDITIATLEREVRLDAIKTQNEEEKEENMHQTKNVRTYICDQCGNNFTCRNHFATHMRRHAGDKNFECELCHFKFCTTSELRRHMRRHTGEKPFPCHYCDRRFADYSSRIKHERSHTNERPYKCDQCGKSFGLSYVLKNHMLTHTGERSFNCRLCNKTFARPHNLASHNRTLMHRQKEDKQKSSQMVIEPT